MLQSNLAYDYVSDIPWDKNPAFAFSNDTEAYMEAFRNVIGTPSLPIGNGKIKFADNTWDFNAYFTDSNNNSLKILFANCPEEIREYAKFFVLYTIMGKTKISTTNVRLLSATSVLRNIMTNTRHNSIYLITTDDIKDEIEGRNNSPSTAHNQYESIYQFYYFMVNNYKLDLPVDLDEIKKMGVKHKNLSKKYADETKLPNIPEEYFNIILNTAIRVMRDKSEIYNNRATACMIVMLSQLGLRLGDLLILKPDQLFSKKLAKSGNTAYYIHYKAHKPSKPHSPMLEFDIFSNSLCTEAFKTLKKLRKNCQFCNEPFLYVLDHNFHKEKDEFPVNKSRFNNEFRKLMCKYCLDDVRKDWDGIKKRIYFSAQTGKIKISIPDTRQFRVHLCTALYEKGIPLVYIQRYMSHLSEYMLGYYVRPKDTYQENIAYSEKVIKEIAVNDTTPLGLLGEDIKKNIKKFITDNNFNVETDIEAIVKAFGDKVVIRGKTGGVCIKTSIVPCSKDARTNEMMCAYNLCPNLFHFYYMADITYINFQTMQDSFSANMKNGNKRAAEKEMNKIRDLLRRRLIPELDELEKELSRNGKNTIIERYPDLRDIIEGMSGIRKEIQKWMND